MNANLKKLEKLQAEYAKNDKKMAALMERQQEIEKQCTALENLEKEHKRLLDADPGL